MATRTFRIGAVPGCTVDATIDYTPSGELDPDGSENLTDANLHSVTVVVAGNCTAHCTVWEPARNRPAWEQTFIAGSETFNARNPDRVGDFAWLCAITTGGG
jgi:hypothetical protein